MPRRRPAFGRQKRPPNLVRELSRRFGAKVRSHRKHPFLKTIKTTAADTLTHQRINDYLHYCITTLKHSENQMHSRINAIKFYYEQVLGQSKIAFNIIRPKKAKQLPRVMSFQDVQKNIKSGKKQ
jgi:site-specific recombinase XerD